MKSRMITLATVLMATAVLAESRPCSAGITTIPATACTIVSANWKEATGITFNGNQITNQASSIQYAICPFSMKSNRTYTWVEILGGDWAVPSRQGCSLYYSDTPFSFTYLTGTVYSTTPTQRIWRSLPAGMTEGSIDCPINGYGSYLSSISLTYQ